jgi:glycosyltransferase involved in cell wall biosynthesis
MKRRAFVLDPVCALPYGHNVVGLKYFSDALRPFFSNVICVAARALPDALAAKYEFEREFNFYYHQHISVPHPVRAVRSAPQLASAITHEQDLLLLDAIRDAIDLLAKFSIGAADVVMFPCVDYYGVIGMLYALQDRPVSEQPRLLLRFIGVMENAGSDGDLGLRKLLRQIVISRKRGTIVQICAETPRYADYLAEQISASVDVVPYPPHAVPQIHMLEADQVRDKTFTVACPGSARLDKGYLSLLEVFRAVQLRRPDGEVSFVTQTLPMSDALNNSKYTNQLYALPNVSLLPESITEEQMNSVYDEASLVLLPYDPATYKYRGSAVFMESVLRGIPVIALAGSAFAEQVDFYRAGIVVNKVVEFAEHILNAADRDMQQTRMSAMQACRRYVIDSSNAFGAWINQ